MSLGCDPFSCRPPASIWPHGLSCIPPLLPLHSRQVQRSAPTQMPFQIHMVDSRLWATLSGSVALSCRGVTPSCWVCSPGDLCPWLSAPRLLQTSNLDTNFGSQNPRMWHPGSDMPFFCCTNLHALYTLSETPNLSSLWLTVTGYSTSPGDEALAVFPIRSDARWSA